MLRLFFSILIIVHGFIHLMGFVKAFDYAKMEAISQVITKPVGILWLAAMLILVATAICYFLNINYWWALALMGAFLSQVLIILYWQDARFGTIVNIIILVAAGLAFTAWRFEKQYKQEVNENLRLPFGQEVLTRESLAQIPEPVKRYITYTEAIGKPVPKNFKIKFTGQIRGDEKSAWMPFTTEQYNFIDTPTRLFFMKAAMKGIPLAGYHAYKNGKAFMDIRLLSLVPVQYQEGNKMNASETVTWFNDLCLYAPGALIDKRIIWESIDSHTAKATFTHQGITISAILFFNDRGELTNFRSEDRYRMVSRKDHQLIPFSTPTKEFKNIHGHIIPAYGEAVWSLPDGDLTYGQFHCQDIQYNLKSDE